MQILISTTTWRDNNYRIYIRSEILSVWFFVLTPIHDISVTSYQRSYGIQVNEKFFELKKGHIGIVEKAQETSSDSDMHNTVCLCHCSTS